MEGSVGWCSYSLHGTFFWLNSVSRSVSSTSHLDTDQSSSK